MNFRYDFTISDLLLRVETPEALRIDDSFQPFLLKINPAREPDILLEIVFGTPDQLTGADIRKKTSNIYSRNGQIVEKYFWQDGAYIVRCEPVGRGNPCQLFIPHGFREGFCSQGKWLNYFAIERALLPFGRFILHASAVIYEGKAYLFSAPSGGGKSTHAGLWEKYYGAKLLNGDKVVLATTSDGTVAYGSPVAGSSGIYSNDSAPVAAVLLLKKGMRNHIVPVPGHTALLSLYSEAVKSTWDADFNIHLLELTESMQKTTSVYSLECLPEKSAVTYVLQKLREMEG